MASTYSTNLALELMGTGDQPGTWGNTTNTNLGTLIEQAISGYVTQAITDGADTTITIPNGSTGVARNMFIECTGTLSANRNLVVPANKKLYFIYNNTSGGFDVTVKVSGQTGVSVPNGEKKILVSNGTDIVEATSYLTTTPSSLTVTTLNATSASITNISATSLTLTNALGVAEGGTGVDSTPTNGQLLIGNGTGFALSVLTAGTGMTITNNAGSITLASAGGIPTMNIVSGTTQTATAGNHYVLTNASATTLTLPSSPSAGDVVWVTIGNGRTDNVIARNGEDINSIAENMTVDNAYAGIQLRYADATRGWVFT